MIRLRALALPALLGLLLAACGGDDAAAPSPTRARTPAASSPSATVASTATRAPDATAAPAATPARTAAGGASITISAVGDISLARGVVPRMETAGAGYPYARVAHLITGDIGLANLEGALTDRGDPWPKGYTFRTPPRFASGLRDAGFDIVSLANNHAMDYGAIGLEDTVAALDAAGVRYAGAGVGAGDTPVERAYRPEMVEGNGLRVAFVACALTPTEGGGFAISDWAAGPSSPGLAICSADGIARQVSAGRALADFTIVFVHAGDEYVTRPNAVQRELAQAALDAGADAFIGHHAHVVQPVEQRGSQLIAWGLGNFIFDLDEVDLANIPEPRVSLILNITLTKGAGVTAWEAVPVVQDADEDRPRPASDAESAALRELLVP